MSLPEGVRRGLWLAGPQISDRGAGVARAVFAGSGWWRACGPGGAGCATGRQAVVMRKVLRGEAARRRARGEGRRRGSSVGLGRRAERREARPARRAGGVRRGSGPGWRRKEGRWQARGGRTWATWTAGASRVILLCRSLRLIFP